MTRRGQALIETAICLPLLLILGLGSAATIRMADAQGGLDAACAAAVAAAARAPSSVDAGILGRARFRSVAAGYPLRQPAIHLLMGDFSRGQTVTAEASATVDLAFAPLPGWLSSVPIRSSSSARIDDWRSRR